MHLERNKTDKKDAQWICRFAIEQQPNFWEMPDSAYFESRQLYNTIREYTEQIKGINNQLNSLRLLLVPSKDTIKKKLYEYNKNPPVKSNILKEYAASCIIDNKKYPEGNISSYTGYLSSDRIRFVDADFYGIKNALESNAKVTFYILEKDRLTTDYTFTIPENNNFKEISSGYFN